MTNEPTEMPDTRRRTRAEITADFDAGTATIREWVGGCAVHGPRLCEELAAWLDYWGGETEWVPWYRAMGRRLPDGELLGGIAQAHPAAGPGCKAFGGMYVEYELPESDTTANLHRRPSDGAVEVLIEDRS